MNYILKKIDQTTMYRTVLYVLGAYIVCAVLLSLFGILSWSLPSLGFSLLAVLVGSLGAHYVFAWMSKAPANLESTLITAGILFLIFQPGQTINEYAILFFVGVVGVVVKYLIVYRNLHILNPAAATAVLVAVLGITNATWWVSSSVLLIPVIIGGLIITQKIRRFPLVLSTIIAGLLSFVILQIAGGTFSEATIPNYFLYWPIIFFATIMATEPLSTPAGTRNHILYGTMIGVLSSLPYNFGIIGSSPELALVIANACFFATTLRGRPKLSLVSKTVIAKDIYEFAFRTPYKILFKSGQYLEWTLPHEKKDTRGIRRYFSIASAPHEELLKVAMKIQDTGSSFKRALLNMEKDDTLHVTSLDGDFILPGQLDGKKLVFIAGGIGITPFRSMIQSLETMAVRPDITLFYSVNIPDELAYKSDFERQASEQKIIFIPVIAKPPEQYVGETGFITQDMIKKYIKDINSSIWYISGPPVMVENYKKLLKAMRVSGKNIKTDYFPGLA